MISCLENMKVYKVNIWFMERISSKNVYRRGLLLLLLILSRIIKMRFLFSKVLKLLISMEMEF